jgi:hypothetical protein
LKEKEKGDIHVTFDDESAFFSHTRGLTLSHFFSSPEDVYFEGDEFDVYSDIKEDDLQRCFSFLNVRGLLCTVDQNNRDYSFLRFAPCDPRDDTYVEYGTLYFHVVSNMNDTYIIVASMYHHQRENSVEPTALVAQVSYDDGDDSTSWTIDSGSTHHMNRFPDEFLNMILEGYDDGDFVKRLVYGTKAYGVGTCIVILKNSVGLCPQICLEDALYVPNLLHHHSRVFSIISVCSQDGCQCHFQSNSYVLNNKLVNIELQLSKGLLWIPAVDPSTILHFVSVIFIIRDAFSSTMFLVHKGTDNTISIHGGYVYDSDNNIECGLRLVRSLL